MCDEEIVSSMCSCLIWVRVLWHGGNHAAEYEGILSPLPPHFRPDHLRSFERHYRGFAVLRSLLDLLHTNFGNEK